MKTSKVPKKNEITDLSKNKDMQLTARAFDIIDYEAPENIPMSLSKLADEIYNNTKEDNTFEIAEQRSAIVPKIVIETQLIFGNAEDLPIKLSAYDECVNTAINSLVKANYDTFTSKQVAQIITGKDQPSQQQIEKVEHSIETQSRTTVKLNVKAQNEESLNGEQIESFEIGGNLLYSEYFDIKFKSNGTNVRGYKIIKKPLLLQYAERTNQVVDVPTDVLRIDEIQNTEENVCIKFGLLKAIMRMKNNPAIPKEITYNEIFKLSGLSETTGSAEARKKAASKRQVIESILAYWKRSGLIRDYETVSKSKIKYYSIKFKF